MKRKCVSCGAQFEPWVLHGEDMGECKDCQSEVFLHFEESEAEGVEG